MVPTGPKLFEVVGHPVNISDFVREIQGVDLILRTHVFERSLTESDLLSSLSTDKKKNNVMKTYVTNTLSTWIQAAAAAQMIDIIHVSFS